MRLVLVEWVDSMGCAPNWTRFESPLTPPRVPICRSVGWLAHNGRECKVLLPHVSDGGEETSDPQHSCGDMLIPTKSIVSMKDLSTTRSARTKKRSERRTRKTKPT